MMQWKFENSLKISLHTWKSLELESDAQPWAYDIMQGVQPVYGGYKPLDGPGPGPQPLTCLGRREVLLAVMQWPGRVSTIQ